jgi:hypothetical protein
MVFTHEKTTNLPGCEVAEAEDFADDSQQVLGEHTEGLLKALIV